EELLVGEAGGGRELRRRPGRALVAAELVAGDRPAAALRRLAVLADREAELDEAHVDERRPLARGHDELAAVARRAGLAEEARRVLGAGAEDALVRLAAADVLADHLVEARDARVELDRALGRLL